MMFAFAAKQTPPADHIFPQPRWTSLLGSQRSGSDTSPFIWRPLMAILWFVIEGSRSRSVQVRCGAPAPIAFASATRSMTGSIIPLARPGLVRPEIRFLPGASPSSSMQPVETSPGSGLQASSQNPGWRTPSQSEAASTRRVFIGFSHPLSGYDSAPSGSAFQATNEHDRARLAPHRLPPPRARDAVLGRQLGPRPRAARCLRAGGAEFLALADRLGRPPAVCAARRARELRRDPAQRGPLARAFLFRGGAVPVDDLRGTEDHHRGERGADQLLLPGLHAAVLLGDRARARYAQADRGNADLARRHSRHHGARRSRQPRAPGIPLGRRAHPACDAGMGRVLGAAQAPAAGAGRNRVPIRDFARGHAADPAGVCAGGLAFPAALAW